MSIDFNEFRGTLLLFCLFLFYTLFLCWLPGLRSSVFLSYHTIARLFCIMRCKAVVIDIEFQSAQASFDTSGHSMHSFYTGLLSVRHSLSSSLLTYSLLIRVYYWFMYIVSKFLLQLQG